MNVIKTRGGRKKELTILLSEKKFTVFLTVSVTVLLLFKLFSRNGVCGWDEEAFARGRGGKGDQWPSNRKFGKYDLVYTDPEFIEVLSKYNPSAKRHMGRYRDYDTLLYSLRSAEKYFPNLNHIYILTNGQVPEWLDLTKGGVSIVSHEQVFPDREDLPTFSSHSIEANLHLIPGLNERFMYCNDDMPFGNYLTHEDLWIEPESTVIYFSPGKIPHNEDIKNVRNIWRKSCMHSNDILNADPEIQNVPQRYHPSHSCYNMRKSVLFEMESKYGEHFNETRTHKFRQADDIDIPFFYTNYVPYSSVRSVKRTLRPGSTQFGYMNADNSLTKMLKESEKLKKLRPKFMCIQDAWGGEEPYQAALDYFRAFMESYFPRKSRWEK